MRFTLAADEKGPYVRDRDRTDSREWQPEVSGRLLKNMERTYGLITPVQDPATGHSCSRCRAWYSAVECLIGADCLQAAERLDNGGLDRRNAQIVVSAAVIGEDSGARRVVAVHSWWVVPQQRKTLDLR